MKLSSDYRSTPCRLSSLETSVGDVKPRGSRYSSPAREGMRLKSSGGHSSLGKPSIADVTPKISVKTGRY
jgi:hypothetical protein